MDLTVPLAHSGAGNPFFYHSFADDFDRLNSVATTGDYIVTAASTGSVAPLAGDGGLILLTTNTAANAFASVQAVVASFTLPGTSTNPPLTSTSVKKLFWMARVAVE